MTTYTTASSNYREVVRDTNLNDIGNILRIVGIGNSGRLNGEPQVVYFISLDLSPSDHERPRLTGLASRGITRIPWKCRGDALRSQITSQVRENSETGHREEKYECQEAWHRLLGKSTHKIPHVRFRI